jgi:hypothetical protein
MRVPCSVKVGGVQPLNSSLALLYKQARWALWPLVTQAGASTMRPPTRTPWRAASARQAQCARPQRARAARKAAASLQDRMHVRQCFPAVAGRALLLPQLLRHRVVQGPLVGRGRLALIFIQLLAAGILLLRRRQRCSGPASRWGAGAARHPQRPHSRREPLRQGTQRQGTERQGHRPAHGH